MSGVVEHEDASLLALARWAAEIESLAPSLGPDQVERLSALLSAHSKQGC